ncbi:cell surface glycoprotein MUC18 isoform X2 [Gopherus flavomarginatus]|uniref:cell surface glycoprotein MUC18 isoform X2 n=1 Tax=Gopherus flavomarginatus TaxID=286002 RepID=UPI0021CBC9AA|nr:cell surface glycoprotein MUC18 isoform X2 [Gopherus flavomarginatus]
MALSWAAGSPRLLLGWGLLLWGATVGASKVEVSMLEMVEVELGQTARIPCNFSLPGESHYAYINWFYIDKHSRTKIYYMVRGQEFEVDPEYKGRVAMENDFTLTISRVTLQDARTFVCQVGAGSLGVGENRTKLHIYKTPEPPEIQVNDAGIPVTSKEIPKIAVCVSKNGFPAPNITWYKNGSPLWQDDTQVSILSTLIKESSGLYTVSSNLFARVSREDRQSRFHCEVSYRLLGADQTAASEKVNVTVFYSTENLSLMIQSPQPQVREGDDVTLRCEGDGNPPPEYNLLKVQEGAQPEERDLPSSNGVLILRKVKKEDSGQYLCRTFDLDSMMKLEDTVELSVNYLEGLKITPEGPIQLQQGEVLTLTCDARGSKPLEFRWKKEKKGKLLRSGKQLKLSNVTLESSGNYSCEVAVTGVPGLSRSKQVNVAVHTKPHISSKDSLVPVQQNELVTLMCKAAALPEPTITWSINGKVQNHTDHHRVISNLTVQVTPKLLQSGVTCTATNEVGNSSHHITLQLRTTTTPPPSGNTTAEPIKKEQKTQESKGVIIVAVIVCILVIAVLGAVLYFLHKKGKIPCNRTGKQDITRPDARKDEIVVEVKSDKLPEETGLLQGANSEKRPAGDQAEKYIDLRN